MSDLISRQAAIKAIEDLQDCYNGFSDTYDKACIIGALEEVPSAQRTGRWIEDSGNIACSECHIIWLYRRTAFCPNCGADMREVESDIDENWYSDEYRRIGEDERDEVEE